MLTQQQGELQLPVSQALALFVKIIRKVSKKLVDIRKAAISADIPQTAEQSSRALGAESSALRQTDANLQDELEEAGNEEIKAMRENQREMINSLDMSKYVSNALLFACALITVLTA